MNDDSVLVRFGHRWCAVRLYAGGGGPCAVTGHCGVYQGERDLWTLASDSTDTRVMLTPNTQAAGLLGLEARGHVSPGAAGGLPCAVSPPCAVSQGQATM